MNYNLVYVTASSDDEALYIGRTLVEERLAACANVLGVTKSVYWWEDGIQTDSESIVILKTTSKNLEALMDHVKKIHSYDCPCVLALNVENGNKDFLHWIKKETIIQNDRLIN